MEAVAAGFFAEKILLPVIFGKSGGYLDGRRASCNIAARKRAHVAELVDAADSKSAIRKDVKVRFLSWARLL